MSFADSLREELAALPIKKPCCRRAFVAGFLLCAKRESGRAISLRCRHRAGVAPLCEALETLYSKAPSVTEVAFHGHRYADILMESSACAKLTGQLQASGADLELLLKLSQCELCHSAFLRGVFLYCGTISDPHKDTHLELALVEGRGEEALSSLLESLSYPPKRISRKGARALYYKDGASVGDLLTMMGAIQCTFEFLNTRIEREIRNDENRATNCVARNIEKSISAATKQMDAINLLISHNALEALEPSLRTTAMLRYRNPDVSLEELRLLHLPPISKSGLNHRLQKILAAAERFGVD